MNKPAASFWRHTITIRRQTFGRDLARGMEATDADAGQAVVCTVQERHDRDADISEPHGDSTVAGRRFDVLIPAKHPTTGSDQFPAGTYPDGPTIRQKDLIVWGGRTLVVMIDVDKAGRGGYGHIFTAQCRETV